MLQERKASLAREKNLQDPLKKVGIKVVFSTERNTAVQSNLKILQLL